MVFGILSPILDPEYREQRLAERQSLVAADYEAWAVFCVNTAHERGWDFYLPENDETAH